MKILLSAILGCCTLQASADVDHDHPLLSELVGSADEIVVARQRPPQIWIGSELVVLTGVAEADVTKSVKGSEESGNRIRFQIVRVIEVEPEPIQHPTIPSEDVKFPKTPETPQVLSRSEDSKISPESPEEILFLRRNQDRSLSALDGFVYALPCSVDLEQAIRRIQKIQAQQGGAEHPATPLESDSEGGDKPQSELEGRSQ